MALGIHASNGPLAYLEAIEQVIDHGLGVSPRSAPTMEVRNAVIIIDDPLLGVPVGVGREMNLKIGAAESVQLAGGFSSLTQLDLASNGRFSQYANNGKLLGAYGPRIRVPLRNITHLLIKDRDTRQAHVSIFKNGDVGNDVPCTISIGFLIRDSELEMDVHMRSNDVWLGLPYDLWQFTRLQIAMAYVTGTMPGTYTHYVDSLHMYESDMDKALAMPRNYKGRGIEWEKTQPPALITPQDVSRTSTTATVDRRLNELRSIALAVAQGRPVSTNVPGFRAPAEWYLQHLPAIPEDEVLCRRCWYFMKEGACGCD
jgi:thymidylate synthase